MSKPPFLLCSAFQIVPLAGFVLRVRTQMFEQTVKNIDNVLWKEAGCSSELDYTEQASWLLFLKYLDDLEHSRRCRPSCWVSATTFCWSRASAGRAELIDPALNLNETA